MIGVLTVGIDCVVNVVAAVVLSVNEVIQKCVTSLTVSYFGYIYVESITVIWNS